MNKMREDDIINKTERFVKHILEGYDSGHDWWHTERVRGIAKIINQQEMIADPFILEITALLHDSADSKFSKGDSENDFTIIREFMDKSGLTKYKERIVEVIRNVSFSNKNPTGNITDPLLLIIQDADRLDAIGAIGIARAFNYGGFRNNAIYIPGDNTGIISPTTIGHFHDKLLKLKDMMNTSTGRRIAEERHLFLEKFLEQFYKECEFDTGESY